MRLMNWRRGIVLALLAGFFSLVHCGVDGNPFYLGLSPTPRLGDVPDAGEEDAPVDDGSAVPDVVTVDATDGGLMTSDQPDDIIVIADAVDASMEVDAVMMPDVPMVADASDVVLPQDRPDVVMSDVVTLPDVVDVVLTMDVVDVVDVVAPQDRPDVVMGTDAQDVVMPQDRPDVVTMPDIVDVPPAADVIDVIVSPDVPAIPDFVVEYISVNGGDVVPSSTGGNVSNLSIAFFEGGAWVWRSYPATRFTRDGSSNWYRVTISALTSAQRSTPRVLLSIVNGCGLDTGGDCPSRWWSQWQVIWFGTTYSGSSWFANENRITCRDFGGFNQGCVTFARP